MRFVPNLSFLHPALRLGVLAVVVSVNAACSSPSSTPSVPPSEIEGPISPYVDISEARADPVIDTGSLLPDALAQAFLAPSGRVERRTSLGVVGFEASMISILTWNAAGGRSISRMEASGPLAAHPDVVEIVAGRSDSVQADDRLLTVEEIAVEQHVIAQTITESIGELHLVTDATGRLVGERIVGDTVERITVEIRESQLVLVVLDFGHASAGGRDEWRFRGA